MLSAVLGLKTRVYRKWKWGRYKATFSNALFIYLFILTELNAGYASISPV